MEECRPRPLGQLSFANGVGAQLRSLDVRLPGIHRYRLPVVSVAGNAHERSGVAIKPGIFLCAADSLCIRIRKSLPGAENWAGKAVAVAAGRWLRIYAGTRNSAGHD